MDSDLKFELDCRKKLLKRLETLKTTLNRALEKEKSKNAARRAKLLEYESEEEIHEA
ncbi:hypothetical protein AGMMS49975_15620 [Clostridia bacterium]|nr:hypothetical protein AGMMS49975_15620 [Clostridia bacterium]